MHLPSKPEDLQQLASERMGHYSGVHDTINTLINVYDGEVPDAYKHYFHRDIPIEVINMIRMAVDDLTAMAGKVFPVFVPPRNNTAKAKKEAELVEKICLGYNDAGRKVGSIGMDMLMKRLAWWLILSADAVAMVLPDYEYKTPYFTFRDPRSHFPPVGWTPWGRTPLDGTMFIYSCTVGELGRMYPEKEARLRDVYKSKMGGHGLSTHGTGDLLNVRVAEFYHSEAWYVAAVDDDVTVLSESMSGDKGFPGVCPVVPFTMFSADMPKGRSFIADQVGIQMSQSRMVSQKIDYYDRLLYPMLFHTALKDEINYGPGSSNEFDDLNGIRPVVEQIVPPNPVDADETIGFLMGISRILNRNPEVMQGGGDMNSGKALDTAMDVGPRATIKDSFWPVFIEGIPKLYCKAAEMDLNLWGNVRKTQGYNKNGAYSNVDYTPNVHLKPFYKDVRIEPGLGLGGFQGSLEIMQKLGAGLISRDTALEQLPEFANPQEEKRRIQADKLEEVMFADLATKAQSGIISPEAFHEIKRLVEEKDLDLFEAVAELAKTGAFAPPAPEVPAEGGGGDLAALEQMLGGGGGAPPAAQPPPLSELRSA